MQELQEEKGLHNKTIAIFTATHVSFDPPNNPIYIPLHVGKYIGDDTGENISDLNLFFAELTGLYWIWQNIHDIDYAGLCHYRRYFINEYGCELNKNEYLQILMNYDAIVPIHAECTPDYREHYGRAHNVNDLDAVGRAIKKVYPKYMQAYDQVMGGKAFYGGNLFVTSLEILKSYSEWLFTIFSEAGEEIDASGYDGYQKKVYGFLGEQMFYVYAVANGLTLYEQTVGISDEKAETKNLKVRLNKLLGEGRLKEARALFDKELANRPDLLLPGSDIGKELQKIYEQLCGESE